MLSAEMLSWILGEALDLDRLYLRLPYADDGNLLRLVRALGCLVQLGFLGVGRWCRRYVLLRGATARPRSPPGHLAALTP